MGCARLNEYEERHAPSFVRALGTPFVPAGMARLLRALAQGDFLINGFRNRDVRGALYGPCADETECRRQAGKVTRQLALLRAHGLIVKVTKTHRYQWSAYGRRVSTAMTTAYAASVEQLAA